MSDVAHNSQAQVSAATARHGADAGASLSDMFAAIGALAFLGALIAAGLGGRAGEAFNRRAVNRRAA